MIKEFNKLVRDRIPEIITANGDIPHTRFLEMDEYRKALMEKAVEEANELCAAETKEGITEKVADMLEVLEAITNAHEILKDEVGVIKDEKFAKRGGFSGQVMLEYTEEK